MKIERLRGQEPLLALTRNTLHLIVQTPPALRKNFRLTAALLKKVPVKHLTYPSGFRHLPGVCHAVLKDLRG